MKLKSVLMTLFLVIILGSLWGCSQNTGEEVEFYTIQGYIANDSGMALPQVTLYLIPADFEVSEGFEQDLLPRDTTSGFGSFYFSFAKEPSQSILDFYALSKDNLGKRIRGFEASRRIYDLGVLVLDTLSTLVVELDTNTFEIPGTLQIVGSPYQTTVEQPKVYLNQIVPGEYAKLLYTPRGKTSTILVSPFLVNSDTTYLYIGAQTP